MAQVLPKRGGVMSMDSVTFAIATAAITSPLWLKDLGNAASDILPLLGAIWLIVQIAHKLYTWSGADDDKKKRGK